MNSNNKYVVNQVYGSRNRNNVQFNNANRYNRYNQLQFNATKCPNNQESFVRAKKLIKPLMHPLLELTNPKNHQINNHRTVQISKTSGIDVKLPKFHQQIIPNNLEIKNQNCNLAENKTSFSISGLKIKKSPANYFNHVNGFVNSQEVRMLVDTGASISLISTKFHEKLHSPLIPLEIPVPTITATQEPILIKGYAKLQVSINGFVAQHKFLIAEKIGEDLILGMDFLQQNACVIDMANQHLKFGSIKSKTTKLISVNLVNNITIKPKTSELVEIKIANISNNVNFQNLIIEGTALNRKKGIVVTESILPTGFISELKIFVTNSTNSEINLMTNDKIANCNSINEEWEIKQLEPAEQSIINSIDIISTEPSKNETKIQRNWKTEFNMANMDISENDKLRLCKLFDEFESTCSRNDMDIGKTNLIEHVINTGNAPPTRLPLRRITPAQRPIIEQKLKEMLEQGIIVRSTSSWCSPVVLVPKKGPKDIANPKN